MIPILTVITTLYNCEKYVKHSLESVVNQTIKKDFEWIILSDAPTDSTWDIVEKMNLRSFGSRVIRVASDENIKIPKRRNQAISMAKGKYIAIHDGDDISLPRRFELEVDFLEKNADVFCVGGHASKIDSTGGVIGSMSYPAEDHEGIVDQILKRKNPMIDPTTMFNRQLFLDLKGYTTRNDIYTVPDFDLWCKAILSGYKLANIKHEIIHYRVNPQGMTRRHSKEMMSAHTIVCNEFASSYHGRRTSSYTEEKYEQSYR